MAGAFEFTGQVQGIPEVEAYIQQAITAVSPEMLARAIHPGAELMAQAVQEHVHVSKADDGPKHTSGQLRESVSGRPLSATLWEVGPDLSVGNVKQYALKEQQGGQIHANNAPMMIFDSAKYGGRMAALTVTHDAQDYMGKGFAAGLGPADIAIRRAIAENLPQA
ncbi:MAG: hypothetical protein JWO67_4862 [Streptosporangiaceae bacterium]|nr:hypothetical protein [Streptosporangiaceae bacterium]